MLSRSVLARIAPTCSLRFIGVASPIDGPERSSPGLGVAVLIQVRGVGVKELQAVSVGAISARGVRSRAREDIGRGPTTLRAPLIPFVMVGARARGRRAIRRRRF